MATFFSDKTYGTQRNKAYHKDRYHYLKDNGLCVICGSTPAEKGKVMCMACRLGHNDYQRSTGTSEAEKANHREYQKRKYIEYKEMGICVICHKNKAVEGKTRCRLCQEKEISRRKLKYKPKYKPEGICYYCSEPVAHGYKICQKHLELAKEAGQKGARKARENRKRNGHIWMVCNNSDFVPKNHNT